MISVIIPAHNEANVIERTLSELMSGAHPNELEVIVVCNGCTDDTATRARNAGTGYAAKHAINFQVIDTPTPGKINALNLGDKAATAFPRLYIDADILLPITS